MKRTLIVAACLAALAGCSPKAVPDPAENAIRDRIASSVGEDAKITFYRMEKVDSTTFGEELERREKAFQLRLEQNSKYLIKYSDGKHPKNAAEKSEEVKKDMLVLRGLEEIRERMADSLSVVAYYDYVFSGKAVTKTTVSEFTDWYATVTPDGQVYTMESSTKGLHSAMGHVIPGYTELVGKDLSELLE